MQRSGLRALRGEEKINEIRLFGTNLAAVAAKFAAKRSKGSKHMS